MPSIGDIILGRIHSITATTARVEIVCVGEIPLKNICYGTLAKENIRDFNIDQIEIYELFKPGDLVIEKLKLDQGRDIITRK